MIPRRLLWYIPALLFLHNLEEALTIPRYLPIIQARAPQALQPWFATMSYPVFLWAVTIVTLVPLAIVAYASSRPGRHWTYWAAALVQAVVALNVASHVAGAIYLGGYAPGVLTAVVLNLPFSIYFFRRAAHEGWFTRRELWSLIPGAVVLHGPVLLGLFVLSRFLARTTGS
jgi:uncharacterized protein with HXXEE motif